MSQRYLTITIETRAGEHDRTGEEITAIYDLDLELDAAQIDEQIHHDIHDHLLQLLEHYQGANQ